MKNVYISILTVAFCFAFQTQTHSQSTLIPDSLHKPVYRTWIYTISAKHPLKGIAWQTSDSTILFSSGKSYQHKNRTDIQEIPIRDIKKIAFRKRNKPGQYALAGAGIGVFSGFLLGLNSGDDDPKSFFAFTAAEKAIILAAFFTPIGTVIGVGTGFIRTKARINGSLETYNRKRLRIQKYTMTRK